MIQRFLFQRIHKTRSVSAKSRPGSSTGQCNPPFAGTIGLVSLSLLHGQEWDSSELPTSLRLRPLSTCLRHCCSFFERRRHVTEPFFSCLLPFFLLFFSFFSHWFSGTLSLSSSSFSFFKEKKKIWEKNKKKWGRRGLRFRLHNRRKMIRGISNCGLGLCHGH